jgi:hypothetical protein
MNSEIRTRHFPKFVLLTKLIVFRGCANLQSLEYCSLWWSIFSADFIWMSFHFGVSETIYIFIVACVISKYVKRVKKLDVYYSNITLRKKIISSCIKRCVSACTSAKLKEHLRTASINLYMKMNIEDSGLQINRRKQNEGISILF